MKFANFCSALGKRLISRLGPLGFHESGIGSYVRRKDTHEINVIWIQKHTSDPKACVNLGVHYDFLPKVGTNDRADIGDIEQPACEIKKRLTPSMLENDHWWSFNTTAIDEIADLISGQALSYFERYDLEGEIGSITPDQLEDELPELLSPLTKVRACLVMARIYEIKAESSLAAEFAKLGIRSAGIAVTPKKILKEILKRNS